MNEYIKNRIKADAKFQLIRNTQRKIHRALNGKLKSPLAIDYLGIYLNSYKRWIDFQMTPELNWLNIEIDHVKPICMFDASKDEDFKEAFSWKKTQP